MTMMTLTQNEQPVSKAFRVDVSRGERVGRVSSEWFSRPDDERYLSLTELHDAVRRRADRAQARTVESRAVRVEASRDNSERLALMVPGRDEPAEVISLTEKKLLADGVLMASIAESRGHPERLTTRDRSKSPRF